MGKWLFTGGRKVRLCGEIRTNSTTFQGGEKKA